MVNVHLSNANYVLVLLVRHNSMHSRKFRRKYWSSTKRALKKISPNITFQEIKHKPTTKKKDNSKGKYPKALQIWNFCYPNILLIPTALWASACNNPQQSLAVWTGVHAFNITSHPTIPELPHYTNKYWLNTSGVVEWYQTVSKEAVPHIAKKVG